MTMVVRLPRSLDGDKVLGERLAAGTSSHGAQGMGHGAWGIYAQCPMPNALFP